MLFSRGAYSSLASIIIEAGGQKKVLRLAQRAISRPDWARRSRIAITPALPHVHLERHLSFAVCLVQLLAFPTSAGTDENVLNKAEIPRHGSWAPLGDTFLPFAVGNSVSFDYLSLSQAADDRRDPTRPC